MIYKVYTHIVKISIL